MRRHAELGQRGELGPGPAAVGRAGRREMMGVGEFAAGLRSHHAEQVAVGHAGQRLLGEPVSPRRVEPVGDHPANLPGAAGILRRKAGNPGMELLGRGMLRRERPEQGAIRQDRDLLRHGHREPAGQFTPFLLAGVVPPHGPAERRQPQRWKRDRALVASPLGRRRLAACHWKMSPGRRDVVEAVDEVFVDLVAVAVGARDRLDPKRCRVEPPLLPVGQELPLVIEPSARAEGGLPAVGQADDLRREVGLVGGCALPTAAAVARGEKLRWLMRSRHAVGADMHHHREAAVVAPPEVGKLEEPPRSAGRIPAVFRRAHRHDGGRAERDRGDRCSRVFPAGDGLG